MRVEPAAYVYQPDDRRARFADRRAATEERRSRSQPDRRARHAAHVWFAPAFGAQILGLISPEHISGSRLARAYSQPEAQMPLRPSLVRSA
jgi:hypothetical protein